MLTNVDIGAIRENSDLFPILLKSVINEIATGVSIQDETTPSTSANSDTHKLDSYFKEKLINMLDSLIDDFWKRLNVSSKLSILSILEKQSPKDVIAWRPVAGEVPMRNIKGRTLQNRKDNLTAKISVLKTKSAELKEQISQTVDVEKCFTQLGEIKSEILKLPATYAEVTGIKLTSKSDHMK